MLKSIGSVVLSVIVAAGVIYLFEYCSHLLFPTPEGLDTSNQQALSEWINTLPPMAMWLIVISWFFGSLIGSLVLSRIDPMNFKRGIITFGVVLVSTTIMNLYTIPHPMWMWPAGILAVLIGLWAGPNLLNAFRKN